MFCRTLQALKVNEASLKIPMITLGIKWFFGFSVFFEVYERF